MTRRIEIELQTLERRRGAGSAFRLFEALADPQGNNWSIVKRFGISIVSVVYLRQNFGEFYQRVKSQQLRKEMAA